MLVLNESHDCKNTSTATIVPQTSQLSCSPNDTLKESGEERRTDWTLRTSHFYDLWDSSWEMSRDILHIGSEPIFDDRIVKIETHTYNPYANTTFGYSDEIRIPIQHQDLYTLPCESFLYVEGKFSTKKWEMEKHPNNNLQNYRIIASHSCSMRFGTS